jgi:hypothetical protein
MAEPTREKITFAEMRASGVRGLLIYCSDYHCSHWTAISGDRWPDDARLSDLDHDSIKWHRIMISSLCLSMIFSENRFPLFRIML